MDTYADLLPLAKEHPEAADFSALRMAYTASDSYNPYGVRKDDKSLRKLLNENNFQEAIQVISQSLELNYLDMQTHAIAANVYRALNVEAKVDYHRLWYHGLVKSILDSGDGRSDKTAFIVIGTSEEYAVLNALGLRFIQQSLINQAEHSFDLMQSVDPKTGSKSELYFNIDIPWQWMLKKRADRHSGAS